MNQTFCLFIAVVFLFGAVVIHGQDMATLESINCSNAESISFSIRIPDIAEWEGSGDQSSWSLNSNTGCEPTFDQFSGLVTYSGINVAVCDPEGPSTTADNSTFEYDFVISVDAEAGSTTGPVTFAYDHNYVVKCFYNREQENIMASFQPRHSLTDSGSGIQDFAIELTVHLNDGMKVYPNNVLDLSTDVYGQVEITGTAGISQDLLDVHLRKVVADRDTIPGDDELTLIADGCADSSVVTSTTCDTTYNDTFHFKVFRYPGQVTGDNVYLRASVIVCLSNNADSVCQTECDDCNTKRKRRNTLEEIQQTEFYVTAGPFKIRDPDQESEAAAGKNEGTALPAYVIAVVAVCGLLAVAIVSAVVLIVFRRRRQNVANVELQNEDSVTA